MSINVLDEKLSYFGHVKENKRISYLTNAVSNDYIYTHMTILLPSEL